MAVTAPPGAARHADPFADARLVRIPWRRVLTWLLVAFGVFAGGVVTTNTYAMVWQRHLDSEWAATLRLGTPAVPVAGQPVAKIAIPDIEIERVVLEGNDPAMLRKAPAHVPGSPLPGDAGGNSIVQGHRVLWSGPFLHIGELNYGAEVVVQSRTGTATYLVAQVSHLGKADISPYADTDRPFLTLVTADPPMRGDGLLVVRAIMVSKNGEPV